MTADPGAGMTFVADPKKPVGGNILGHASQTRIMVSFTVNIFTISNGRCIFAGYYMFKSSIQSMQFDRV